jgi:tripartite-type tricarboxylate transporter receptor subunit TctC
MDRCRNRLLLPVLVGLIILALTVPSTHAQPQDKYPGRAVDFIVPFVPGGGSDIYARLVAEFLKKRWNVPINVINKPGGGTVIANLEVYQAKPDGYTVLADAQSSCSLLEIAIRDLPFKILDRTFLGTLVASPSVFHVASSYPWKNMKDLESEARRDPGDFTWTSMGSGAGDYLARLFFKAIGVDVLKTKPVLTKGAGESNSLVAGAHVKMGLGTATAVLPMVKGGMTRPLGITAFRMEDYYPGVPTTAEQGYPTLNPVWWFGFSGPPNLSPAVVSKWDEAIKDIMKDPEFLAKVKNIGGIPFHRASREFKEHVRKESEEAGKLWGLK